MAVEQDVIARLRAVQTAHRMANDVAHPELSTSPLTRPLVRSDEYAAIARDATDERTRRSRYWLARNKGVLSAIILGVIGAMIAFAMIYAK